MNGNCFERTNVYFNEGDNMLVNTTRKMYEKDLGKVNKKEKIKSKNK
jgi:hypothetical protein